MKKIIINIIKFYRKYLSYFKSMVLVGGCRFTPTCSVYSLTAVEKYGVVKGLLLTLYRIFRCNPFYNIKFDPVK